MTTTGRCSNAPLDTGGVTDQDEPVWVAVKLIAAPLDKTVYVIDSPGCGVMVTTHSGKQQRSAHA